LECVHISAGHSAKAHLRAQVSCLLGSFCCFLSSVLSRYRGSFLVGDVGHSCVSSIEVKKKWSCTPTKSAELALGIVSDSASKFL